MSKPVIFLAMPRYGTIEAESAKALWCLAADDSVDTICCDYSSSLLPHTFNTLWCQALNHRKEKGLTHFAMLHPDINPEVHWVNRLLDVQRETGADIVSAVVPIKTGHGVTSTAIDSASNPFEVERRLTMREVHQLPETFDSVACGYPGRTLCVNSGCWIADLSKLWVEDVFFQIRTAIGRNEKGEFYPRVFSEDWDFSRQVARKGGKIVATRRVQLDHIGPHAYSNRIPWGSYEMDHMAAGKPLPVLMK